MGLYGEWLRRERRAKDWTQGELGQRLGGVTRSYISGVEKGVLNPPKTTLTYRIAKVFGVNPEMLLLWAWIEKSPDRLRPVLQDSLKYLEAVVKQRAS